MWVTVLLFFIPFTILFLVLLGIGFIYFYMGMIQVVTGLKEQNLPKKTGGFISLTLSLCVIALASYVYFKWVWLW